MRVQEHAEALSDQVECVLHRLFPISGPHPPALACEATSGGTSSEQKVREGLSPKEVAISKSQLFHSLGM
jgi:hypothetical protein